MAGCAAASPRDRSATVGVSPAPDLLSALAEESRLRAFAAVLLGPPRRPRWPAGRPCADRDALRALTTLQSAGLVDHEDGGWVARPERLREAAMAAAEPRASVDHGVADDRASAVLRTFMPHGRIETDAGRTRRSDWWCSTTWPASSSRVCATRSPTST